jgi:hypothetical protein
MTTVAEVLGATVATVQPFEVRWAGLGFLAAGWSGQQPRPTHRCSDNVDCGFTLSAIAVPVPAIMASATIQPAIIFMSRSSYYRPLPRLKL